MTNWKQGPIWTPATLNSKKTSMNGKEWSCSPVSDTPRSARWRPNVTIDVRTATLGVRARRGHPTGDCLPTMWSSVEVLSRCARGGHLQGKNPMYWWTKSHRSWEDPPPKFQQVKSEPLFTEGKPAGAGSGLTSGLFAARHSRHSRRDRGEAFGLTEFKPRMSTMLDTSAGCIAMPEGAKVSARRFSQQPCSGSKGCRTGPGQSCQDQHADT